MKKQGSKSNLDKYLDMSWHFSATPSEWEGQKGYWAWVSELPDCSTFAPTQSEALSIVAELLPVYLTAALESHADIPVPEGRDPDADSAGGTIVLRIPKSLHIGLKHAAAAEKTSLNQFALYALTKVVYQTTAPSKAKSASRPAAKRTSSAKRRPNERKSAPRG
jgi:predicted RNase H-like HicB family nuclease